MVFNYSKIAEISESFSSAAEKIEFYKKVLENIDNFYKDGRHGQLKESPKIISPEERIEYFEIVNLKKLLRTKIFFEELEISSK